MTNDKLRWITVRVPSAIRERLEIESVRTGKTFTKVLIAAIEALPQARIVVDDKPRRKVAATE